LTLIENYELDDMAREQARFAELVEVASTRPTGTFASRAAEGQDATFNRRDWGAYLDTLAPEAVVDDRRSGVAVFAQGAEAITSAHQVAFTLDRARIDRELLATRGDRLALFRTNVAFEDGAAGPAEVECFNTFETDEHGRITMLIAYNLDDLDVALAELDARADALSEPNLAWRVAQAHADYVNTGNWDALVASLTPEFEDDDRRTGVGLVTRGEQARQVYRTLFALDKCRQTRELVAARGERLALVRSTVTFEDGDGGPAEVVSLNLFEVDSRGFVTRSVKFNVDDLEAASAEHDVRAAALGIG
jgi:hypothetical protein